MNNPVEMQDKIAKLLEEKGYTDRIGQHKLSLFSFGLIRNPETNMTIFYNKRFKAIDCTEINMRQVIELLATARDNGSTYDKPLVNENLSIVIHEAGDHLNLDKLFGLGYPMTEEDLLNCLNKE